MTGWILIIFLHGWGAGVGSTGNAVTSIEFYTQDRCEAAKAIILSQYNVHINTSEVTQLFCVQK